ncbi:hypothetical protein X975_20574, partial [Stegodyphus mimosarum]
MSSMSNLNFSFHLGLRVWGLTDVVRMNLAGRVSQILLLLIRSFLLREAPNFFKPPCLRGLPLTLPELNSSSELFLLSKVFAG